MANELAVVLGAGPVGRALAEQLTADGQPVRVVTRSGQADVAPGVDIFAADITKPDESEKACDGAAVVYSCVGLDYQGWPERWPLMMRGMLVGAQSAGARFVFMDNCYMYGPVDTPMHEGLPLTTYGKKPATRSRITRMWQEAHAEDRLEAVAVRASDFYGAGVAAAALGESSVGRLAQGKSAQVFGNPDLPHSFTYVPDIARALVTIGRAGEDAMGQAWNVPNAPDESVRRLLQMFANELGQDLKIQTLHPALITIIGLFDGNVRELKEMLYQWNRPFRVDASKFEEKFWSNPTPFSQGISEAAPSYAVS